jgi:hypothetical protein
MERGEADRERLIEEFARVPARGNGDGDDGDGTQIAHMRYQTH